MRSHIRAVLFDMDGTLLNTTPDIAACLNRSLIKYGLPPRELADYGHIIGGGIKTAIRRAAPVGCSDELIELVHTAYQGDYPFHCTVHTSKYPGMDELLDSLIKHNIQLAVFTNKTQRTAQIIAKHFFKDIPFKFVWGNDNLRPLKPDPTAGQLACAELKLSPEQVVYMGDGDVDMLFATAAGFVGAGACWGYRGREELDESGATILLEHPTDLLNYIDIK